MHGISKRDPSACMRCVKVCLCNKGGHCQSPCMCLPVLAEPDLETMTRKAVRKKVAAQLQCQAEQIKVVVKDAIAEFMERRQHPGGQERGADAEAGM